MGLSNTAARLTTSAVAIAPPSNHRRPPVRNVTIDARMPQPERATESRPSSRRRTSIRSVSIGTFGSSTVLKPGAPLPRRQITLLRYSDDALLEAFDTESGALR